MSTSERVQMWAMRGLTAAEITHQTKLPRSTVKYHLKRFKETGSWSRREYPVRVKTLTPFADCIRKHLKLHPHASATELHELLATKYQLMVSVRTVQRYLKSAGREQKRREDSSEADDSDTSTTEELSVASGSDRSLSPKLRTSERTSSVRISTTSAQETTLNAHKPPSNIAAAVPTFVLGPPALNGPFIPSTPTSLQSPPSVLPLPFSFVSPFGLVSPSSGLSWPDGQNTSSAISLPHGFPLLPSSLPLGFLPFYPPFNSPLPSDCSPTTPSTPAFIAPTASPASPSTPVTPASTKSEPGLEALLNAALVNE